MTLQDFENTRSQLLSFSSKIDGVDEKDMPTIKRLYDTWQQHYESNQKRTKYFNADETVKNLNISIPEDVARRVKAVVGWSAKAVRALADLSVYDGLQINGDDVHNMRAIAEANQFSVILPQAIISAYKHSCSFLAIYKDADADGAVRITPRSALMSSALWDMGHQEVKAAMTITGTNEKNEVNEVRFWLKGYSYEVKKVEGAWKATLAKQSYQGVSVVPVCYDPQLDRPFGRSRITRPLMSYTDMAIRTFVRMEATAEFYSIPKIWFLGLSEDAQKAQWSSYVSAVNGVTKDEDGDTPTLQQLTQASMTPHSEMLKTIALMVASETGLPACDLGITTSNPTSAEAMSVAERKLTREADRQNLIFSQSIIKALGIAVCLQNDGMTTIPPDVYAVQVAWKPTQEVSMGARGDFFNKVAATCPSYAMNEIAWRQLGFSDAESRTLLSEARKTRALESLNDLLGKETTIGNKGGYESSSSSQQEDKRLSATGSTGSTAENS